MKQLAVLILAVSAQTAFTQELLQQEIIEYSIEPCYETIVVRQGLTEYMSVSEAVELLKITQTESISKSVNALIAIVRDMDSFRDRKAIYDLASKVCINGADKTQ